ncbi:MAG: hypothetical protein V3V74_07365 [Nitrosomonadaceae bacterium]
MFKTKEEAAEQYDVDLTDPEAVEDYLEQCEGCKRWGSPSRHCHEDDCEGVRPNDSHFDGDHDEPATIDGVFHERLCWECCAKASNEQIAREEATPLPPLPLDERIKNVVTDASFALGECLVKHFPEVKTGDESPEMVTLLNTTLETFTKCWYENNKPENYKIDWPHQDRAKKLMKEKKSATSPALPINHLQLKAFTDYDNTALFIQLLELLKPQGFEDSSYKNDEWPSMINTKFVIHVSYSADYEYNGFDEVFISIIHLDKDECVTDEMASFNTVEELTKYLDEQNA